MINNIFTPMEIDAIGEIMNISLGSSATSVSNMLDHRVDITTPRVSVVEPAELSLGDIDPAVGVEIRYVSGLMGSNIMLLKRSDVKSIVDILMGTETSEEEFELNELTVSAVCELMNQMMGAASTALSDFLGRMVNISTPQSFELRNFEEFKAEHFPPTVGMLVVVRFTLSIEGALQSEFMNIISVELARDLISGFGLDEMDSTEVAPLPEESGGSLSQAEVEKLLASAAATPPPPAPAPSAAAPSLSQNEIEAMLAQTAINQAAPASSSGPLSQDEVELLWQREQQAFQSPPPPPREASPSAPATSYPPEVPPGAYPPPYGQPYPPDAPPGAYPPFPGQPYPGYYPPQNYYYPVPPASLQPEPKVINTQPVALPQVDVMDQLDAEQAKNLDLIMAIPLDVSVEIGRTRRKVQEILSLTKGSLIVLDKLAGEQVDLYVNGQCIAKGDVVVIDDNFGIRITAILTPADPRELIAY